MLRSFLIYGVGGAASRLAAVFLVPLYTRALDVGEYGTLELLLAVHMGAVLLSGLQSESAILRDYYQENEAFGRKNLIWSGLGISVSGAVGLSLLTVLIAAFDAMPVEIVPFVPELLALILLSQILGIQLIVLRCADRAAFFATVALLDFALAAVTSAWLIVQVDLGVRGALWGMLCGKTVAIALACPATFGHPPAHLRRPALVGRMLAYAVPTLPAVMLNWAQTNGSRVLLAAFFTLQDVAIVGVAVRVAAIYGFVMQSFRLAWEPHAFRNLDGRADDPQYYDRALQLYSLPMLLTAGMAMLLGPPLVALFAPPGYSAAVPLVGFFIAGNFWLGAISILSMGIHGARVTGKLTNVFGAGAMVNATLLLVLEPWLGITSAAVGFLASTVVAGVLAAGYSNRHYATGYAYHRIATLATLSALLAAAACALAAPVELDAFDWADYVWRSGALLAVLTVCLGILMAGLDAATRATLSRSVATLAHGLKR